MSLRTTAYTIEAGSTQQLEMTCGEDREFDLTFTDGGVPISGLSSYSILKLTVRNRSNSISLFARSPSGFVDSSTPRFQVLQADTVNLGPGPYDVDVQGYDGTYWTELLATSTFLLLRATGRTTDLVTSPPGVPVGILGLALATGTTNLSALRGYIYRCDPSGGAFNVQLPQATGAAGMLMVVNQSLSDNAVTVLPYRATGASGYVYDTIALVSTGVALYSGDKLFLYSDAVSDWMVL